MTKQEDIQKMRDTYYFEALKKDLRNYGMWELTPKVVEKIWAINNLKAPNVERTSDVKDRVSFITHVNHYAVSVHTTFNRKIGRFSRYGIISVVIEKMMDSGSESVLFRFFYKKSNGSHVRVVSQYVKYILHQLKYNWPLTGKKELASLVEFENEEFYWVHKNGRIISNFFADTKKYPIVRRIEKRKYYYHRVVRKRKKIRRYRRDIRKKYDKKK
jgi:hypothetical protein